MCDFHWASFVRTLESVGSEINDTTAEISEPFLLEPAVPRFCYWGGCSVLVYLAFEMPTAHDGMLVKQYFCDAHRPQFYRWLSDRNVSVSLKLIPACRTAISTWFRSLNGWKRLWLTASALTFLTISLVVWLTLSRPNDQLWWAWVIAGFVTWTLVTTGLYVVGLLVGWIRRGFARKTAGL
jgi:hypothetical protein